MFMSVPMIDDIDSDVDFNQLHPEMINLDHVQRIKEDPNRDNCSLILLVDCAQWKPVAIPFEEFQRIITGHSISL